MAAVLEQYPIGDRIVRGDPLTIPILFPEDVSAWTWQAQIRATPDSEVAATFTVTPDPDLTSRILLSLSAAETRQLGDGYGWDLASVTPVVRTWIICRALRVEKDYSHA